MKIKRTLCAVLAAVLFLCAPATTNAEYINLPANGPDTETSVCLEEFSKQLHRLYETYDARKNFSCRPYDEASLQDFKTARIVVKSREAILDPNALDMAGPYKGIYVFQYETAKDAAAGARYFETKDFVDFAQPDRVFSPDSGSCAWNEADSFKAAPNRAASSSADWAPGVCQYSKIQEILKEKYGSETNMPTVVVADIDSGIAAKHAEFTGRILDNGKSFVGNSASLIDTSGHGTATAGCITMNTPSNVKILPIRLFYEDNPAYTDTGIYDSIQYAISQKADIVNMSFSGGISDPLVRQAVNDAANAGIVLIAAYGNNGRNTSSAYPACYDNVIAVPAVNRNLERASFSNYGPRAALSAPGESIYTANKSGGYTIVSGTSFSCPYVSAGAALVKTYNPKLNPLQIRAILCGNVIDKGPAGWDGEFGSGILCFSGIRQFLNSPQNAALTHERMTVRFDTNGGSPAATQTVNYGSSVSMPSVTKNGCHLAGWYLDPSFQKAFSAKQQITANLVLYAKWENHKYNEKNSSILKKTSYTAKGKKQYVCSVCGKGAYVVSLSLLKLKTPKLKSAAAKESGISLSWKKITGASGYYVYRKESGKKWKKIKTVKKKSKTVSYTDKSAKKNKTYSYRIRAFNKAQKSKYSPSKSCANHS